MGSYAFGCAMFAFNMTVIHGWSGLGAAVGLILMIDGAAEMIIKRVME